jgi:hypothetical protein
VVRLARKARGVASGDEAEIATSIATLAPEVRAVWLALICVLGLCLELK